MSEQLHLISKDSYINNVTQKIQVQNSSQSTNIDQNPNILNLILLNKPIFLFLQQPRIEKLNRQENIKIDQKLNHLLKTKSLSYCRKEKSLQELSRKFIDCFEGKNNNILELDKVTEKLGVERRRMYDIINILESLGIVMKCGKNRYKWKGLFEAIETIKKCQNQDISFRIQTIQKQKSLQFLAGGFLNLFLHIKPAISLQYAIKELVKNADQAIVKTKIRRLYDIVNVFKSLGLVKKVVLPTKKPGFQWVGTSYIEQIIQEKKNVTNLFQTIQQRFNSLNINSIWMQQQQLKVMEMKKKFEMFPFNFNHMLLDKNQSLENRNYNDQTRSQLLIGFGKRLSAFSLVKND